MEKTSTCPKCNYVSTDEEFNLCPKCGIVIKKYYERLERGKKTEEDAKLKAQQEKTIREQRQQAQLQEFKSSNRQINCPACQTSISINAVACPKCGQPLTDTARLDEIAKRYRTQIGCGIITAVIILFILLFINLISRTSTETTQITKKDGSVDSRINDLDELCEDFVYYKAKAYKYGREGNEKAASDAREGLAKVNASLSQYRDSDVSSTCEKYDTAENLSKYMK